MDREASLCKAFGVFATPRVMQGRRGWTGWTVGFSHLRLCCQESLKQPIQTFRKGSVIRLELSFEL